MIIQVATRLVKSGHVLSTLANPFHALSSLSDRCQLLTPLRTLDFPIPPKAYLSLSSIAQSLRVFPSIAKSYQFPPSPVMPCQILPYFANYFQALACFSGIAILAKSCLASPSLVKPCRISPNITNSPPKPCRSIAKSFQDLPSLSRPSHVCAFHFALRMFGAPGKPGCPISSESRQLRH